MYEITHMNARSFCEEHHVNDFILKFVSINGLTQIRYEYDTDTFYYQDETSEKETPYKEVIPRCVPFDVGITECIEPDKIFVITIPDEEGENE